MSHSWGYAPTNGPTTWSKIFPNASGTNQSPIDIRTSEELRVPPPSTRLQWRYNTDIVQELINTGHGWKAAVDGLGSELYGGPLEGRYQLEQFHCHWGKTSYEGSEHTIDGRAFAGELHLVHRNVSKYRSFEEAAMYPDGLCVLGIFLAPGEHNNELDKITSLMPYITHKNKSVTIEEKLDVSNLIPPKSGYFTYYGSLTTPPCSECVIWIVFQDPIEISEDQLEIFRTLKYVGEDEDCDGVCLHENFRPTLPLGQRKIIKYSE